MAQSSPVPDARQRRGRWHVKVGSDEVRIVEKGALDHNLKSLFPARAAHATPFGCRVELIIEGPVATVVGATDQPLPFEGREPGPDTMGARAQRLRYFDFGSTVRDHPQEKHRQAQAPVPEHFRHAVTYPILDHASPCARSKHSA